MFMVEFRFDSGDLDRAMMKMKEADRKITDRILSFDEIEKYANSKQSQKSIYWKKYALQKR